MLPEQIGERLVRQLLDGSHPVARELLQLAESVVVEGDQFAHALSAPNSACLQSASLRDSSMFPDPNNGQRTVAVRRLQMADQADESLMLTNMIEDSTTRPAADDVAA
jgi:hypothetical protein